MTHQAGAVLGSYLKGARAPYLEGDHPQLLEVLPNHLVEPGDEEVKLLARQKQQKKTPLSI